MSTVAIVDSGGANIASVQYALERLGCRATLTTDHDLVRAADRVLLPGVGAAAQAMARLREHRLDEVIRDLRQPVLGICLGMQLLFEASDEGDVACLGILPGRATRFPPEVGPVPHMGWNQLEQCRETPLLTGVSADDHVYFVHSYALPVGDYTLATTCYGAPFSAAVQHESFFGVQFHPERSGKAGAKILESFLGLRT